MASVAEHIEAEHFKPLALQALQMGMGILEKTDDPDVKKSVYALFAALSGVMKQEINPALPKIVQFMLDSIQNTDGIIVSFMDHFLLYVILMQSLKTVLQHDVLKIEIGRFLRQLLVFFYW